MATTFPLVDQTPGSAPSAPTVFAQGSTDPRALRILAKSIYRELRQSGLAEQHVMSVAGELLSLVAGEVKDRRQGRDGA